MRRVLLTIALAAAQFPLFAQQTNDFGGVATLIPNLFDRVVVLIPEGHEAHFVDSSDALLEAGLLINSSIVQQLAAFPLGSSAGGFTYEFNDELGIFERTSDSFGSVFAERAETIGKGRWNFGANFFGINYDTIDNLDLKEGELEFSLTHLDSNFDGTSVETFFEGDLIFANANIDLKTESAVLFGSYGVTERFDLGLAIPFVRIDLDAALNLEINRLASSGFRDPPFHRFPDGSDSATVRSTGSSSGIGDILLRAKYNLAGNDTGGFAVALDVRLPTGDEEELLGTGATQTKLFFIGNTAFGRFSPHVNFGYAVASGESDLIGEIPDEINFVTGFTLSMHPRVTFASDIVWKTLLDTNQIRSTTTPHLFRRWDEDVIRTFERPVLQTDLEDLNLVYGALGFKINLVGEFLLTANLTFSLSDEGLQDEDVIPFLSLDYSF